MRSDMHVRLAQPRPAGRRLTRALALAASLIAGMSGCMPAGSTDDLQVIWGLEPGEPAIEHPARARVTITTPEGRPVSRARLQIEGHMTHPGMAPVVVPAVERHPGVYEAEMHFTMAGPWILVASGTLEDGRRLTRTLDVPDVR